MPDVLAVRPDAQTAQTMQALSTSMQAYLRTDASRACARFYLLMEAIGKDARLSSLARSALTSEGAESAEGALELINETRQDIEHVARCCAGLESGALELAAWRRADQPGAIFLGVWRKGTVPSPGMEFFPLLPVLVIVGLGVTVAGMVATNLWLSARETAAKADLLRAQTEQLMAKAIASAPVADRAALADAFAKASRAADPGDDSGWLTKFGRGLAGLATDFVKAQVSIFGSLGEWLPWAVLGGLMLLGGSSRRRRRRRA